MKERTILGYIACPTCGLKDGMRITEDKNGDPFGFCESHCGQQLRIGGDRRRVRDFFERYPHMQRRGDVPATPAAAATAAPTPKAEPEPAPKAKTAPRSAMADALRMLGAME